MIYFTSDLHLGHKNIIKYCQRPYSEDEVSTRMVEDILKMFDDLPSADRSKSKIICLDAVAGEHRAYGESI